MMSEENKDIAEQGQDSNEVIDKDTSTPKKDDADTWESGGEAVDPAPNGTDTVEVGGEAIDLPTPETGVPGQAPGQAPGKPEGEASPSPDKK